MTRLDSQLITNKLQQLQDYLKKLEELQSMDQKLYVSDYHYHGLAEHFLQLSIETVLDICRYLVIALELKTPDDAHGLSPLLAEHNVLSAEFAQRNFQMAGFRNRLVHAYAEIDHGRTYEYLRNHLNDFRDFVRHISQYLLGS